MANIVQSNHGYVAASTSLTGVTAGNVMLVVVSWNNTAGTPGISDTMGNGYTMLENTAASSNFTRQTSWYAPIGSSGNVTVNVSGGFSDQGITIMEIYVGGNTSGLIVNHSSHTGSANPDTVTLQGYKDGIAVGMYASESTPVANPSGFNLTQLRYDAGHADWQGYAQLTTTAAYQFGYTGSVQNNQNYHGVIFGKFVQPTRTHTTDIYLRKTVTKTHTTDVSKKIVATKTHTTDVLKKKQPTRSHTTDIYKLLKGQRTHTTDILKRAQTTKAHTTDTLKKKQPLKTHSTDILKRKQISKTHTTDTLKRKQNTRTHTADTLKKRVYVQVHTTSTYKRYQLTKVHTTDIYKKKQYTKTHTTSIVKRKVFTLSHTTTITFRVPNPAFKPVVYIKPEVARVDAKPVKPSPGAMGVKPRVR